MNFCSLESETAQVLTQHFELGNNKDSMVLIRKYNAYIKSCAALRLCWYMKFPWPLLSVFLIIPPFLRNRVYDFIAQRRLKWFGLQESCLAMAGFRKDRFLP